MFIEYSIEKFWLMMHAPNVSLEIFLKVQRNFFNSFSMKRYQSVKGALWKNRAEGEGKTFSFEYFLG